MKKLVVATPIFVLFIISIFVLIFLLTKTNDQAPISPLINKQVPNFEMLSLFDDELLISNKNMQNKKVLINFFASWCTPCKLEHHLFFEIKKEFSEIIIIGINHKDKKEDAINYIKEDGNPYNFIGVDFKGNVGFEFGVFGLPETFLINESGKIIYKKVGPLTKKIINNEIKPLL
tara:strand:- start:2 stop:526 length:525 start_codon:yes stop_codon:yes gene_type:complete